MSNEIQVLEKKTPVAIKSQGMAINNMEELWRFAVCVQKSGIAPKSYKTTEQIVVGMQCGMELGFTPMASLKAIAVINGTPCVWGDGLKALVERSPECEYVKEWITGEGDQWLVAHCEAKRKGRPEPTRQSFSYADAKQAGLLGKDTYKSYLRRMLQMRARSWALRDAFPDLLQGLAVAEEVQDYEAIEGQLVSGDPAPQAGVQSLLESMDTDEGIAEAEPVEFPDTPWAVIANTTDESLARAVYDTHCGPDSDSPIDVSERCSAAWNKRIGLTEKEQADSLFS